MAKIKQTRIDPGEFHQLNQSYYRTSPHDYLNFRLISLVAFIDEGPRSATQIADGVAFDGFRFAVPSLDSSENVDKKAKYATADSIVLLHHACEVLLRLYLAHADRNPCPWVAMSSLTNFTEFKREVAKLRSSLDDEKRMSDLLEVVSGTKTNAAIDDVDDDRWASHAYGLRAVFEFAIRTFLDDSPLYNAAKHGFAIIPQDMGVALDIPDTDFSISQDGPAMTFLERTIKDGATVWGVATQWVTAKSNLAWTALIVKQVENLWNAARMHHGIALEDGEEPRLHLVPREIIDHLHQLQAGDNGIGITRMSMSLQAR
jgi:hypothetical protein